MGVAVCCIQRYSTYSCRRRSTARPQQTRLFLLFARSVSISSSSRLARLLEPIINVKSTTASQCQEQLTGAQSKAKRSSSSSSIRPSRLSFVCVSVHHHHQHLSHNLLLAIAPSSSNSCIAISFLTIVLSAITRAPTTKSNPLFARSAHTPPAP